MGHLVKRDEGAERAVVECEEGTLCTRKSLSQMNRLQRVIREVTPGDSGKGCYGNNAGGSVTNRFLTAKGLSSTS